MSSTTLLTQDHSTTPTIGVAEAMHQLRSAAGQMLASVVAAVRPRTSRTAEPTSRAQAAANAREIAFKYRQSDPGFAADLFAAADHHERGPHDEPARPDSVMGAKR
ncbi:MAG: hypothetical protein OEY03_01700 [Rhizobacter sp.]|nr:hypothetical protein [Rhizobacter sp.]